MLVKIPNLSHKNVIRSNWPLGKAMIEIFNDFKVLFLFFFLN